MAIHKLTTQQRTGPGSAPPLALPAPDEPESFGLDQIFGVLRRRRGLILAVAVLGTGLAFLAGSLLTPKYTATAEVVISTRDSGDDSFGDESERDVNVIESIQTEINLIKSGSLLDMVMSSMGLYTDPAFQPDETGLPGPVLKLIQLLPPAWQDALGIAATASPQPDAATSSGDSPPTGQNKAIAIEKFRNKLEVAQQPDARIIAISFTDSNPGRAAEIANGVADAYIDFRLELKRDRSRQAETYLAQTVDELRDEVETIERRLEQYRIEKQLGVQSAAGTPNDQRYIELSTRLSVVQGQLDERRARLQQAEASSGTLDSPTLATLRAERSRLERELAQAQGIYGPNHPEIQRLNAELNEVRNNVGGETARLLAGMQADVQALEATEQRIQEELSSLQSARNRERQDFVQLRELERQADAKRALYQEFLGRYRVTQERVQGSAPDASVVTEAVPPQRTATPPPYVFALIGFTISLMLGCMLAFLKDRLDNRVQSSGQIERMLGLSVLGLLPKLTNRRAKRWPGRYIAERPFSSFAEAARSIVTGLGTHRQGTAAPVLLVTSALPHEGKTTLAISLAAAAASSGLKTLLIDLDLRCPSLDDRLADTIELPGLVDHLKGQLQRSQLIQRDEGSGIDYVVVGEPPHNPLELLQSPQLRHLIETWRREYDQVFIDSAPVLAVTDTRVAVRLADRALIAAMWQDTDVDAVSHAVRSLLDVGAEIAGVVLTAVNMKKYKLYARGEAGTYYKRYRRYYLE
jgi:capsular exopolysaccharide synthesis family protein